MNYTQPRVVRPLRPPSSHLRKGSLDSYQQRTHRKQWQISKRKSSLPETLQRLDLPSHWQRPAPVQSHLNYGVSGGSGSASQHQIGALSPNNANQRKASSATTAVSSTEFKRKRYPHSKHLSLLVNFLQLSSIGVFFILFYGVKSNNLLCSTLPHFNKSSFMSLKTICASSNGLLTNQAICKYLTLVNGKMSIPDVMVQCNEQNMLFNLAMYACLSVFGIRLLIAVLWHLRSENRKFGAGHTVRSKFFEYLKESSWSELAARVVYKNKQRLFLYNLLMVLHVATLIVAPAFTLASLFTLLRACYNMVYYAPGLSTVAFKLGDVVYSLVSFCIILAHALILPCSPGAKTLLSALLYYTFFLPYYSVYAHFRAAWSSISKTNGHQVWKSKVNEFGANPGRSPKMIYARKDSLASQQSNASSNGSFKSNRTLSSRANVMDSGLEVGYPTVAQPGHSLPYDSRTYQSQAAYTAPSGDYPTPQMTATMNNRYLHTGNCPSVSLVPPSKALNCQSFEADFTLDRDASNCILPTLKTRTGSHTLTHGDHETILKLPNPESFPVPNLSSSSFNEDAVTILTVKDSEVAAKQHAPKVPNILVQLQPDAEAPKTVLDKPDSLLLPSDTPKDLANEVETRLRLMDQSSKESLNQGTRFSVAASTILPDHSVSRRNSAYRFLEKPRDTPSPSCPSNARFEAFRAEAKSRMTAVTVRDSRFFG